MNKIFFLLISLMFLFAGCEQSSVIPEPEPKPIPSSGKLQQATLIYAVNNNNLRADLESNTKQIVEGLRNLPEKEYEVYIFRSDVENKIETCNLYRAVSGNDPVFELVRSYSDDFIPTNPERMKEVVSDFLDIDCKIKNFFFWGHGTAWFPFETDHQPTRSNEGGPTECNLPELYSFGGYNFNGFRDNLNIDEIQEAIPDNAFETIWFDCCYMSNIETIYELRNKSKYIVAYPTEIWQTGLPYHHVLPKIFQDTQDLPGAAQELYNFYKLKSSAVTVAVLDMSKIEDVAKSAREIFNSGRKRPSTSGLMNYSRESTALYDLGQYVREYAQANDCEQFLPSFSAALDKFVICAYTYDYDFWRKPIIPENFSGISTHFFMDNATAQENYYRTLDWYKATYAPLNND